VFLEIGDKPVITGVHAGLVNHAETFQDAKNALKVGFSEVHDEVGVFSSHGD
jgi:hypothetical protein